MFLRIISGRQLNPLILLYILILIFIFWIIFQSSKYLQYSFCPLLNLTISSLKMTTIDQIFNNTEDEQTSIDDYSIWCLHMAHRLDYEHKYPQLSPSILHSPSINSSKLHRLPYFYSQWKSSPYLSRRLTPCEHSLIMRLLMIIERICRKHQITYMISDGTLLGSLRHHDIIPWDDDIDMMIPVHDQIRFINLIKQMNETLVQHRVLENKHKKREYYKIFFKNTPSAGGYSWSFPFVDVFVYAQNETHLWQIADPDTTTKLEYVFPLVMRPLGELWLPGPRKAREMFQYNPFDVCKGHFWDHRKETGQKEILLRCNDLKHIYPFVDQYNQSSSKEILRLNHTIIHTIIYP